VYDSHSLKVGSMVRLILTDKLDVGTLFREKEFQFLPCYKHCTQPQYHVDLP